MAVADFGEGVVVVAEVAEEVGDFAVGVVDEVMAEEEVEVGAIHLRWVVNNQL